MKWEETQASSSSVQPSALNPKHKQTCIYRLASRITLVCCRLLRSCFAAWRTLTLEGNAARVREEADRHYASRVTLERSLHASSHQLSSAYTALQDRCAALFVQRSDRQLQRRMLRAWHCTAVAEKKERRAVEDERTVVRAFLGWKQLAALSGGSSGVGGGSGLGDSASPTGIRTFLQLDATRRTRTLRTCLRVWSSWAGRTRTLAILERRLGRTTDARVQRRCLRAWLFFTQEKRRRHRLLPVVLRRRALLLRARCFRGWAAALRAQSERLASLSRAALLRLLRSCFRAWRGTVRHRRALRFLAPAARDTLQVVLLQWRQEAAYRAALRGRWLAALTHVRTTGARALLRRCLGAWRHLARKRRQLEGIEGHLVLRKGRTVLARSFLAWRTVSVDSSCKAGALVKIARRFLLASLRHLFLSWRRLAWEGRRAHLARFMDVGDREGNRALDEKTAPVRAPLVVAPADSQHRRAIEGRSVPVAVSTPLADATARPGNLPRPLPSSMMFGEETGTAGKKDGAPPNVDRDASRDRTARWVDAHSHAYTSSPSLAPAVSPIPCPSGSATPARRNPAAAAAAFTPPSTADAKHRGSTAQGAAAAGPYVRDRPYTAATAAGGDPPTATRPSAAFLSAPTARPVAAARSTSTTKSPAAAFKFGIGYAAPLRRNGTKKATTAAKGVQTSAVKRTSAAPPASPTAASSPGAPRYPLPAVQPARDLSSDDSLDTWASPGLAVVAPILTWDASVAALRDVQRLLGGGLEGRAPLREGDAIPYRHATYEFAVFGDSAMHMGKEFEGQTATTTPVERKVRTSRTHGHGGQGGGGGGRSAERLLRSVPRTASTMDQAYREMLKECAQLEDDLEPIALECVLERRF